MEGILSTALHHQPYLREVAARVLNCFDLKPTVSIAAFRVIFVILEYLWKNLGDEFLKDIHKKIMRLHFNLKN